MTEFLARADGSFGLQVHCTIEPGVMVIASKGQPMCIAFDPIRPLILMGSESEAVSIPVDDKNTWLPERLDLDAKGEVRERGTFIFINSMIILTRCIDHDMSLPQKLTCSSFVPISPPRFSG